MNESETEKRFFRVGDVIRMPHYPTLEYGINVGERLMQKHDLTCELWREYDFGGRVYRIDNPAELYARSGGSTHRVVDSAGIVHCLPAPGVNGCVIRWQSRDPQKPVAF